MQSNIQFKKGSEHRLTIDDLVFGGNGISKVDGFVIFTKNTIPGDDVDIVITKKKQNFAEAKVLKYHQRGTDFETPPCDYFVYCGGCRWQDLNYQAQLRFKQNHVKDSIERIGEIRDFEMMNPVGADPIYAYRNKMEFTFSNKRFLQSSEFDDDSIDRNFALGLHVPRVFDKVLNIDKCHIQDDIFNGILNDVNQFVRNSKLAIYDLKSHQGIWRFLMLRKGANTNQYMVNFVTSESIPDVLDDISNQLIKSYPQITSIVNNLSRRKAQVAIGEEEILIHGKASIEDKLGDYLFEISANSFFQTNTFQAERMYQIIYNFLDLNGDELIFDLYCGTGTIPIYISQSAKQVLGFEIVESAVINAKANAERNGVTNCEFHCGDVKDVLPQFKHMNPDLVIMDPPRAGLHPKVVENVMDLATDQLIYVSCNPATLARDLNLMKAQYRIEKIQVIDMFPHTYHIETIVKLRKIAL